MSDSQRDSSSSTPKKDDPTKYWGYLFKPDKRPTHKLDRLLRGIASCICAKFDPRGLHSPDVGTAQLSSFYHDVGGDYDALFVEQPSSSIAYIYKSLGCLHSLQPDPHGMDGYAPTLPALKPQGFVTWQTIQILLGPQEHVPFIQRALVNYNVIDPHTNKPFPKILPSACFPSSADHDMEKWHDQVTEKLRIEASVVNEPGPPTHIENVRHRPPPTPDAAVTTPGEERAGAVRYFSSDSHHDAHHDGHHDSHHDGHHHAGHDDQGRPKIIRTFSKAAPPKLKEGGKAVALTFRNIANPYLWSGPNDNRSSSRSRRHSRDSRRDDDVSENDRTSVPPTHVPHVAPRPHINHVSATPPRKHRSPRPGEHKSSRKAARHSRTSEDFSSEESDTSWEDEKPQSPHRRKPRRHRSYDPPTTEYFDRAGWDRERPSSQYLNEMGHGAPTHRRKSADHGHPKGRERAHFSVSEGSNHNPNRGRPPPDTNTTRGFHQHRASVGHARPTQGYSGFGQDGHMSGRTSSSRPHYPPAAFTDPWAAEEHAKRGFDHNSFGGSQHGPYVSPPNAPPGSATMSPPGISPSGASASGASPPDSSGGMRPSHRYVTPSMPNNTGRGRAYPSDTGWRQ